MIKKDHPELSLRKQCELLEINRNRLAPRKSKVSRLDNVLLCNFMQRLARDQGYGIESLP